MEKKNTLKVQAIWETEIEVDADIDTELDDAYFEAKSKAKDLMKRNINDKLLSEESSFEYYIANKELFVIYGYSRNPYDSVDCIVVDDFRQALTMCTFYNNLGKDTTNEEKLDLFKNTLELDDDEFKILKERLDMWAGDGPYPSKLDYQSILVKRTI